MIDFFRELQTVGLNALFNPTFLFLLVVLFFLGRLAGWMTRNINVWKFLALAYFGFFLFRPLQDAGLIIGGVFILGVASMYMDLFRGIFGWAGGFGDVVSAFRFRGAYEDIRRLEREIEALKSQLRTSQTAGSTAGGSSQQASWRAQSQARRSKSSTGTSTDGRGDGGSSSSTRGGRFSQSSKPIGSRQSGGKDDSTKARSSSGSTSYKKKPRGAADGSSSSQQKPLGQTSNSAKPNAGANAKSSRPRSGQKSQSSSQSQSNQRPTGSQNQSGSQSQSGTSGPSATAMAPALRAGYLSTLELTPGQTYTEKELKTAWRKMAFKTHPDQGGSAAAFGACLAAYKALK